MDPSTRHHNAPASAIGAPDRAGATALPESYANNRLVLMARDPTWAHLYWDVEPARMAAAVAALGNRGRLLLRLRDLSSGHVVDEREVGSDYGKIWLPFPGAGRPYVAELAMASDSSDFVLLRSNVLIPPPDTPSATTPVLMISRFEQGKALASRLTLGPSRSGVQPAPARVAGPDVRPRPLQLASEARLVGLSSAIRLSRHGTEGRLSRQLRFRGLRPVTRVIALPPRYVPVLIRLLALFFEGTLQPRYQVRSAPSSTSDSSVTVGGTSPEPVAGTFYVAVGSYGDMVVAPDQSAPSRGVPGTYYYFTGNGWVEVEIGPDGGTGPQPVADTPDAGTSPDAGSQPSSPNVPNLGPDPFDLGLPKPGKYHLLDDNQPFQISPELLDMFDQEMPAAPDGGDLEGDFGIDGGTIGEGLGQDSSGLFAGLGFGGGYSEGDYGGSGEGGFGEGGYGYGEGGYGYGEGGYGYGEGGFGDGGYGEAGYGEGGYGYGEGGFGDGGYGYGEGGYGGYGEGSYGGYGEGGYGGGSYGGGGAA